MEKRFYIVRAENCKVFLPLARRNGGTVRGGILPKTPCWQVDKPSRVEYSQIAGWLRLVVMYRAFDAGIAVGRLNRQARPDFQAFFY